jgi:hypothetical protein
MSESEKMHHHLSIITRFNEKTKCVEKKGFHIFLQKIEGVKTNCGQSYKSLSLKIIDVCKGHLSDT